MTRTAVTHLEEWMRNRLHGQGWRLDQLPAYQLERLNRTVGHVKANSPFYSRRLKNGPALPLTDPGQVAGLPFTTAEDLRRHHLDMLCVSHSDVARVVTLTTSGTSSAPKRLYFGASDLELTIDFFHHGMRCLVRPGQRVLIVLPGTTPDSVGDLLKRGLARIPASGHIHWPVHDLMSMVEAIDVFGIDCLVGAPAQIFALCRYEGGRRFHPHRLKSVLLSTDYVPRAVAQEIQNVWGCTLFEHYGMTEMGLGGGLHCDAHHGYHLREADLLVEIVDPHSAAPLPPGEEGEVVFTTLTRRAMPLVRYRTGDLAAWLEGACACGSVLRRLGKVRGRLSDLSADGLSMPALDEAILALPGICSFQAAVSREGDRKCLELILYRTPARSAHLESDARTAVAPLLEGRLERIDRVAIRVQPPEALRWDATGMIKRTIADI
jgi:phenylacetate-CoA ligase